MDKTNKRKLVSKLINYSNKIQNKKVRKNKIQNILKNINNKMEFIQSKSIQDYSVVLDGLYPDFGSHFCHTILKWCEVMAGTKESFQFWEVWLIRQDNNTIGICGLYSLDDKIDTLWLGWFGIIPEFRNGGLGVECINFLKDTARSVGASKIMSYVGSDGKPLSFYYRNGFIEVCRVEQYVKENNLDMEDFESGNDYIIECIL